MKQVRIGFVGMGGGYNCYDNIFVNTIKNKFDVVIDNDTPEYIICSMSGRPFEYLKFDGVRIFYSGENVSPDFNFVDYAIGFDKIKYGDRFCRNPKIIANSAEQINCLKNRDKFDVEDLAKKKKFCNFIYSHDRDDYKRKQIFDLLSKYKTVDSLGSYLNNMPGNFTVSMANKYQYQQEYKFTIAMDSVDLAGFITEKIADGFRARTIPIYLGDPCVGEIYNTNAFVDISKFSNYQDLLEYIIFLDQNDDAYMKMLNEPVYALGFEPNNMFDEFELFLTHIFEQEYQEAYRRCKGPSRDICGALQLHENYLKEYEEIYDSYYVRLRRKINKLIRRRV